MKPDTSHDKLEQLVDRALRQQPLRRAPAGLEQRVLAEIARRAQQPWWRMSFVHWPQAARLAFFAVSLGFVAAGVRAAMWLAAPLDSATQAFDLPPEVTCIQTIMTAIATVYENTPSLWLYGGIALIAALYAALFGIGAAAYRTVYPLRAQAA